MGIEQVWAEIIFELFLQRVHSELFRHQFHRKGCFVSVSLSGESSYPSGALKVTSI